MNQHLSFQDLIYVHYPRGKGREWFWCSDCGTVKAHAKGERVLDRNTCKDCYIVFADRTKI